MGHWSDITNRRPMLTGSSGISWCSYSFLPCIQEAADAASSAMVSIIGLDSEKVQLLCDAANEEVDEKNKVQIANFLCPVSSFHCSLSICITFFFLETDTRSFCNIRVIMQFQEVWKVWKQWRPRQSHLRLEWQWVLLF